MNLRQVSLASPILVAGIMSGTSLDAVDVALVQFPAGPVVSCQVVTYAEFPLAPELRKAVLAAMENGSSKELCLLNVQLGQAFGHAASQAIEESGRLCSLVACHGQTMWHAPANGATLQLGDASSVLEACPESVQFVVSDFRSADCAAGGQGAPLVPFFDEWCFGQETGVALVNIGGMTNLSLVDRKSKQTFGFDTGPGNVLMDFIMQELLDQPFDADGALMEAHWPPAPRLCEWLMHRSKSYLEASCGPQSTGREMFGAPMAREFIRAHPESAPGDLVAALGWLTVELLVRQLNLHLPLHEVLVSGGGAANKALMEKLQLRVPLAKVSSLSASPQRTQCVGLTSESKEAVAFAVLGLANVLGVPASMPSVTGAKSPPRLLGVVTRRAGRIL